jgi:hypothetical protein
MKTKYSMTVLYRGPYKVMINAMAEAQTAKVKNWRARIVNVETNRNVAISKPYPNPEQPQDWAYAKLTELAMKEKKERRIKEITILDIVYLYCVGISEIAIATKPTGQWSALPVHNRVCFTIEPPAKDVEEAIKRAILAKIKHQKANGTGCANLPDGMKKARLTKKEKTELKKRQMVLPTE